jgi:hypothetical protein
MRTVEQKHPAHYVGVSGRNIGKVAMSRRLIAPPRLIAALGFGLLLAAASTVADARGGHRHHAGNQTGSTTGSATGRKAGNDEHLRAASEEIDKVLDSKIKNICRGC